jgi:1-phosphofructokinase
MTQPVSPSIVTVTLNPTIDRIIEVPGFHVGGHDKGRLRSRLPAGKAINVSRAMSALGCSSTATGWVGSDSAAMFELAVKDCGIAARFVPIAGSTRENITIIDPVGQTETHIRDAGPAVTEDDIRRLSAELASIAGPNVVLVFTGSCAPGLSDQQFGALLKSGIDRGARVVVDSSGEPLRVAARLPLWLIKPNLLELGELLGYQVSHETEIVEAGRRLNEHISVVLVTMGEGGAMCFADGRALKGRATVPPDRVRSTVGCGDAMLAGFLAATTRPGWLIGDAFRQALAVSAASAMTDQPAVFHESDASRLSQQTEMIELMPQR